MENRDGYKKTELGWIPESWAVKKLRTISDIKRGLASHQIKYSDSGVRLIKISDFKNKEYNLIEETEETKRLSLLENDILIAGTGATAGITHFVGVEWAGLSFSYNVPRIRTKQLNPKFLFFALNAKSILRQQFSLFTGNAQHFLDTRAIGNLLVPLPPLPEQQKIASILTTVDDKISSIEAQIQQTEQLKKGLMAKLLTEGIGNTEFKDTEIGRIPKGWEVVTLQTLLDRKSILHHSDGNHGSLYPRSNEFITHGIPYIGANSIQNGRINLTKAKYLSEAMAATFKKGVAYNGDVLFASNATVGPVALLYLPYNYSILSTTLTLYRCDINQINNYYLFFYLSSALFTEQYLPLIKQTTRNQLPITAQRTLKIILPPFSEQQQIASILSSVDDKIDILQSKKSAYTTLKKGLMAKLLTGQIRVKI